MFTQKTILHYQALKNLSKKIFSDEIIEILERPHSLIIKKKDEGTDTVMRIILLKPSGFSSNHLTELSSHNEVLKAKIVVKGVLREEKKNFSTVKNCLKFSYLTKREAVTESSVPYAQVSDNTKIYKEKIFSAKDELYVVKENGEGFYHNLINLSDDWLVLVLKKELRSGKEMNIASQLTNLSASEKKLILELMKEVHIQGDDLFHSKSKIIEKILKIDAKKLLPVLIEALNIYETGRHEPCTVFALLLNKGKTDKEIILKYLRQALESNKAPTYYLNELIEKIERR